MYHFPRKCSLLVFVAPASGCKPLHRINSVTFSWELKVVSFFFLFFFFLTAPSDMKLGWRH